MQTNIHIAGTYCNTATYALAAVLLHIAIPTAAPEAWQVVATTPDGVCGLFEETEGADDFGHVHWCGPACKAASLASRGGGGGGAAAAAAAAPLQPQLLLQQHPPARLASRGALAPPARTLPTVLRQAPAAARGARPPVPQQASARGPLALALPPVSAWTCPRSAACTTSGCPCTSCMGSAASAACTATATGGCPWTSCTGSAASAACTAAATSG